MHIQDTSLTIQHHFISSSLSPHPILPHVVLRRGNHTTEPQVKLDGIMSHRPKKYYMSTNHKQQAGCLSIFSPSAYYITVTAELCSTGCALALPNRGVITKDVCPPTVDKAISQDSEKFNKANNMIVDEALELQSLPRQWVAHNSLSTLEQQKRLLALSRSLRKHSN